MIEQLEISFSIVEPIEAVCIHLTHGLDGKEAHICEPKRSLGQRSLLQRAFSLPFTSASILQPGALYPSGREIEPHLHIEGTAPTFLGIASKALPLPFQFMRQPNHGPILQVHPIEALQQFHADCFTAYTDPHHRS